MQIENNIYWDGTGKYQGWVDTVSKTMPTYNKTDNEYMNVFISICKIYYEIYNNGGGNLYDGVYGEDIDIINEYLSKLEPEAHETFSWKQAIDEPEYLESKMNEIIETLLDKDLTFVNHGFWVNYDKRELSLVEQKGEYWFYITYGTEANADDEMRRMKSHGFTDIAK